MHYPPLKSMEQSDLIEKVFLWVSIMTERLMEVLLLRGRGWRKQMRIVNTWFILKKRAHHCD